MLRSLGVRAEAITQYTGLPFKASELAQRVAERAGVALKQAAEVKVKV